MRPKIVITVLLVGLAGLAIIFFLKPPANPPQVEVSKVQPVAVAPETNPPAPQIAPTNAAVVAISSKPTNSARVRTARVTGPDAEYIEAQINRLEELQANDDDASLQAILKELTNSNPIVRHVAIEATIQFGGHSAVPVLQDLATRTTDPIEKKELQDAAEFLALPSWREIRAQNPNAQMPRIPPVEAGQP